MKRIIPVLLALALVIALSGSCFADVDLSGMSYDELVALKDQINLAIWNSAEWQEVEVPQGVWEVGADIPAGHWTITSLPGLYASVYVGPETKNGGADVHWNTFCYVYDESFPSFDPDKNVTSWSVELNNGDFVKVEKSTAVFSPYSGKPSLGFK